MVKENKFGQIKQFMKVIGEIMNQTYSEELFMNKELLLRGNEIMVLLLVLGLLQFNIILYI